MRQYVACRFPGQTRSYTYENRGEPLAVDDRVVVIARGGSEAIVQVVAIAEGKPPFDTKPVLRKAE